MYAGKAEKLSWNQYFEDIGNGRQFRGEWDETKKHPQGLGIVKMPDGSEYRGQFYNDKFQGRGQITKKDGSIYWGDWKNGIAEGRGTFYDSQENSFYNGSWNKDKQHGNGREEW